MSTNWAVVFFISLRIFCIVSFGTTFELSVPSLARTTQFNTANKQRSKMPNYTVAKVLYVGFFHHLNKSRNFMNLFADDENTAWISKQTSPEHDMTRLRSRAILFSWSRGRIRLILTKVLIHVLVNLNDHSCDYTQNSYKIKIMEH